MSATVHRAIRLSAEDHEELKRRAAERGTSYTRLLVDSALGKLPEQQHALEERVAALERSVERLEHLAFSPT